MPPLRVELRSSRDVHTLLPRNCGYVNFHDRRDSADVIKRMDLEMGKFSFIIPWPQCNQSQGSLTVEEGGREKVRDRCDHGRKGREV